MSYLNKAQLIGRCGGNPDVKTINEQGRKAAQFSLATTEKYRDRNSEVKENTEWHNIVAFDKTAELIEKFVTKGMLLYVEGKLRTRSWDDQNGIKRYITEVLVNNVQFLERKEQSDAPQNIRSTQNTHHASSSPMPGAGIPQDDDLPF